MYVFLCTVFHWINYTETWTRILKVKTFTSMIMVHTVYDGVHHVLLDTQYGHLILILKWRTFSYQSLN